MVKMIKCENQRVICPDEMRCLGKRCPYINVPMYYCDSCGLENVEYKIDGKDFCLDCADEYVREIFDNLSLE